MCRVIYFFMPFKAGKSHPTSLVGRCFGLSVTSPWKHSTSRLGGGFSVVKLYSVVILAATWHSGLKPMATASGLARFSELNLEVVAREVIFVWKGCSKCFVVVPDIACGRKWILYQILTGIVRPACRSKSRVAQKLERGWWLPPHWAAQRHLAAGPNPYLHREVLDPD